ARCLPGRHRSGRFSGARQRAGRGGAGTTGHAEPGGAGAAPTAPAGVRRSTVGSPDGTAYRDHDGLVDVRGGGHLEVPHRPGADRLPGLREGPAGYRRRRNRGGDMPLATAGPRFTPVELARLLGLPPPTREQVEIISAPVVPLLVVAGAGSGKT